MYLSQKCFCLFHIIFVIIFVLITKNYFIQYYFIFSSLFGPAISPFKSNQSINQSINQSNDRRNLATMFYLNEGFTCRDEHVFIEIGRREILACAAIHLHHRAESRQKFHNGIDTGMSKILLIRRVWMRSHNEDGISR